jgi:hypothetical protein
MADEFETVMKSVWKAPVKMVAEFKIGKNWGEMEKYHV